MKRNCPSHITSEPEGFARVEYKGFKYMKVPGGWQFWSDFGHVGVASQYNQGGYVNLVETDLEKELDREFSAMLKKESF